METDMQAPLQKKRGNWRSVLWVTALVLNFTLSLTTLSLSIRDVKSLEGTVELLDTRTRILENAASERWTVTIGMGQKIEKVAGDLQHIIDVATGPRGEPGLPGSTILFGIGTPALSLGANRDLFIDTQAQQLFEKTSSGWVLQINLGFSGSKGDQGGPGVQGPVGPQGVCPASCMLGNTDDCCGATCKICPHNMPCQHGICAATPALTLNYNGIQYLDAAGTFTYDKCQQHCQSSLPAAGNITMDMAFIRSQLEFGYLNSNLPSIYDNWWWLAPVRPALNGVFAYRGVNMTYASWFYNEPSAAGNCVQARLRFGGSPGMSAVSCTSFAHCLCMF